MNKFHTYFGQVITDTELNEIFDSLIGAIEQFVEDFGYSGIAAGGIVTQHTPLNLSVDISGGTVVYDQAANRIAFGSPLVVDCTLDENGADTAVLGSANEKWLSIFIKFIATPADPRTDDLGNTVYYRSVGGYEIRLAQGAEATVVSGAAVKPTLRGDQILLADVKLGYSQVSLSTANVSTLRTQTIYNLTGAPIAIKAKGLSAVLQAMVDAINTVSGATLIIPAISDSPTALSSGTVLAVFTEFLAAFNAGPSLPGNNVWSGDNVFSQPVVINIFSPDEPLWSTNESSGTFGTAWLEIGSGHTNASGGSEFRLYSGSNNALGQFAIVVNARWHLNTPWVGSGGEWRQLDTSLPSVAILMQPAGVRISLATAGLVPWTDWPIDEGNLDVGGQISATGNVHSDTNVTASVNVSAGGSVGAVSGNVTAGDMVTATNNIEAGGDFVADGDFKYRVQHDHLDAIDFDGPWTAGVDGETRRVSIELPEGAIVTRIDVMHYQPTGTVNQMSFWRTTFDWSDPGYLGGIGHETLGMVPAAAAGVYKTAINIPNTGPDYTGTIDKANTYSVTFMGADAGSQLRGLRIAWSNMGPK